VPIFASAPALRDWGDAHALALEDLGFHVGAEVRGDHPLAAVLAAICRQVAVRLGVRRASIFLAQDGRTAPAMASFADGHPDEALWRRFESSTGPPVLVEAVFGDGQPHEALAADSPLIAGWWAHTFDVGSAVAVPLGAPGRVAGVLVLDRAGPAGPDRGPVDAAATLAAGLYPVIEWARVVQEFRAVDRAARATRRLLQEGAGAATLEQAAAAVVRAISEALDTDRNAVLYFPQPDVVRVATVDMPAPIDQALHDAVDGLDPGTSPNIVWAMTATTARFCVEGDAVRAGGIIETLGLRSWAAIPLLSASGVVGHVVAGDAERVRHWSTEDRRLVDGLAAEGALIIDAARLREADRDHRTMLAYEATHDQLTGLPNRRMAWEHLVQAVALGRRDGAPFSVLLVDLDRFKLVNDTLGHHRGDELLVKVAGRLVTTVRGADLVTRLGGDEFAILLPRTDLAGAVHVADNVTSAFRTPVDLGGVSLRVEASIGIATFPDHGDSVDVLLQRADLAMYEAKRRGGAYEVFTAAPGLPAESGRDAD